MRKVVAVVGIALLVGACGGRQVWQKAGSTEDQFNRDRYECSQQAYGMAPPDSRITGGTSTYNSFTGVQTDYSRRDVNRGQRDDLVNQCLEAKGYRLVRQRRS